MRYAIYYAPAPGSELHRLGAQWLGRDAHGHSPSLPKPAFAALLASPVHYGFHATLKAPFSLREDRSFADLVAACGTFAQRHKAVSAGRLVLRDIDGFLALVPEHQTKAVNHLAKAVVEYFDDFRQEPDAQELARRRASQLTKRQEGNLLRWGYPYVDEDFRLHLSLTQRLSADEKGALMPAAQKHFSTLIGSELIIDRLCIFREMSPQQAFSVEHSEKLESPPQDV